MTEYAKAEAAAAVVAALAEMPVDAAVVLGSGLGAFAGEVEAQAVIPYDKIPHWPAASVTGHEGRVVAGLLRGRRVLVLSGRTHFYEGFALADATFGVRVLGLLRTPLIVFTNAAGGIRQDLTPGSLVVVDDHLNLTGQNPLIGENDRRFGPRFPDMSTASSPRLRELAHDAGRSLGIKTAHGVYAWVAGPSYETPAEVRCLAGAGADLVGMSTVPEVLVARHMGIEVLAISCVTNRAAGFYAGSAPSLAYTLDHDATLTVAGAAAGELAALIAAVIERL